MKCPICQLENPPDALRCDCGYDFPSGTMKRSYLTPKDVEQMDRFGEHLKKPLWLRCLFWTPLAMLVCTGISRLLEWLVKFPRKVTVGFVFCVIIGELCLAVGYLMWSAFRGVKWG